MAEVFLPRELFKNRMDCFLRVPHFHHYVKFSVLNSLWAIPSLFLFLDDGPRVYFHNYLRSLNSRILTSVKQ